MVLGVYTIALRYVAVQNSKLLDTLAINLSMCKYAADGVVVRFMRALFAPDELRCSLGSLARESLTPSRWEHSRLASLKDVE